MHKRKGVLASSLALLPLKLCIFFCLFPPFLTFFNLFYLFPAILYPFLSLFHLFFFSSALFRYLIFPFHILLYSSTAFIFLSLVITSIPFPYLLYIPLCTSFILCPYSVVLIILLMCLSLYSLLPECLDALPHVPEVLYHL